MANVGFLGGSSLFELGPVADVECFFDCAKLLAVPAYPKLNWSVLMERFFCRYLRLDELTLAQELMGVTKEVFASISSSNVDWGNMSDPSAITRLDPNKRLLDEVFSKYFEAFAYCRESSELFYKKWNEYQPLRIVKSDLPALITEKNRRLQEYDSFEGVPFWKR